MPHSARIWNYWLGGKDNFAVTQWRPDSPPSDEVAQIPSTAGSAARPSLLPSLADMRLMPEA